MSFHAVYYLATFAIALAHSQIASVKGQCTTEGCEIGESSMSIIEKIEQQSVQAFGQQNKQIQNIHDVVTASFQQLTTQLNVVMRSLQTVDRRLVEHDIYIKEGKSFHELINASFQEMKNQHDTVNKSFQAVDRRLLEQSQGIQAFLNESFQEIKSQQGNVMTNQQAAGQSSQEHDICTKHISGIHELLNESLIETKGQHDTVMTKLQAVERRFQEHDICIMQSQVIHELLNESVQQTKSQHETVMASLQDIDRYSQEHTIYSKQVSSIHAFLNESLKEMKGQHATIMISLQAVDRRSQEHNICIKQSQSFHELLNASFQEIKNQHETVNRQVSSVHELLNESLEEMKGQHDTVITKLIAVDRRFQEHNNICIKQRQDIQELLNASFQEIKSQYETVNKSFQAVDRRLLEQGQSIHVRLNESFQEMKNIQAVDRRSHEQDVCINQVRNIYEFLNESLQPTKSQHDTVRMSLQELDRLSHEHNIYIKQVPIIYELLNKSFQQMTSQFDAVDASLQTVDRSLENNQIDIKNQTEKTRRLFNDICDPVYSVRDCSGIKARGHTQNGVYEVCAGHQPNRLCANAYCDMRNSTSLVFQRRKDGSVDFNRTWAEYKDGFGDPDGEFWLGNEMIHLLTSKRNYKLRVDLEDWEGEKRYAEYSRFSISSSINNYALTIGGYSGNAGDSMYFNNGRQFSTIDYNQGWNCAGRYGGAWWYFFCGDASLNGKYHNRNDTVIERGIYWYLWKYSYTYSLKAAEMKLVPVA